MKVGLVGGGNISDTHARAALAAGLTLVGVFGDNHARSRELAQRYGIVAFDTLDALVVQSPLDLVLIGSPSGCHAEQARTAALAGCHVLVEKPLDISTDRIDKLLHNVERTGVTLGVFFQDRYELQILDSYNNRTYRNGQAGSIYKDHAPLVNAMRSPLEWNTYDVIYTAPRFKSDGQLDAPARITVLHNGVLVQNNATINGLTLYIGLHNYPSAHGDDVIHLQDHGNKTQFRNIWIRKL